MTLLLCYRLLDKYHDLRSPSANSPITVTIVHFNVQLPPRTKSQRNVLSNRQDYEIVDQTNSLDASLQRIRWLASGKRCNARMRNVCTIVAVTSCTNIQQHFYVCKSTLHNKLWGMQFGRLCVKMEQGYHGKCNIYTYTLRIFIYSKE